VQINEKKDLNTPQPALKKLSSWHPWKSNGCLGRKESAHISHAHHKESTGLQKQVHKEMVPSLEIIVIPSAKHQKTSCPELQYENPAPTSHANNLN